MINTPTIFTNTARTQTIYIRITNKLHSECYANTSFDIEVFELPVINSDVIFKNCDEDGVADGFTDYNLEKANTIITNATNVTITYHLN